MNWESVGAGLTAVFALATGAWAWILKNKKAGAETRAAVAESNAERAVADSQATIYKLLNERLTTLEKEVRAQRAELDAERRHSRKLQLHVYRLEGLMRRAGIEPPPLEEDFKPGGTISEG